MANNLTLTSATFDTSGQKFGTAALSGGNGTTSAAVINGLPFAVELRFKRSGAPGSVEVISGAAGSFWIGLNADGSIHFDLGGPGGSYPSISGSGSIADGAWHTAAFSVATRGATATLDGAVIGTMTPDQLGGSGASVSNVKPGVRWQSPTSDGSGSGYTFGGEVDEVAFFNTDAFPSAYTPRASAYTGAEAGLVALYHLDGNGNDSAGTASSTTAVAPNAAALIYSPGNWLVGSGSAKTINPGAYFRCLFTGASCTLNFDVSANSSPLPIVGVNIDGQGWQYSTLAATVTATMPSATSAWPQHTLEMVVIATSEYVSRWSPQSAAVTFTGLTLDNGATVAAVPALSRQILVFGDSITEGYLSLANTMAPSGSDARLGWAFQLGRLLGAEVGVIGFGGTGLLASGGGGVPPLGTTYNQLWSGQTRTFGSPALVVIEMGQNDSQSSTSAFQAAYQSMLSSMMAAVPSAKIACMRPFSGAQATQVQAAVAVAGASRVSYVDTTGMFNSADSVDGYHPLGVAHAAIAPALANALLPLLGGSVPTYAGGFH